MGRSLPAYLSVKLSITLLPVLVFPEVEGQCGKRDGKEGKGDERRKEERKGEK